MNAEKFEEKVIPIDKIRFIRTRDRDEEKFKELAESLKVTQIKPVLARAADDGFYEVFSGEGRIRALQEAGHKYVNALVYPAGAIDEREIFIDWIATNARRDAPPLDVARLMVYDKEKGLSTEEIAYKYGKKPATVRQKIRTVEKAHPGVLDLVGKGKIRFDQAQEIVGRIPGRDDQKALAEMLGSGTIEAKDTGRAVTKFKQLIREQGRLPKIAELHKVLRSLDSQKADLNKTIQIYSTRLTYSENFTSLMLEDVKFLKLLNSNDIRFSDVLGTEV